VRVEVSAFTIPTDAPESDGTLEWDATTLVLVEVHAGDKTGLGYTYGPTAIGTLIDSTLRELVEGADPTAPGATWARMQAALRNAGRPGVGAMAISAVDVALWDLKAKLLDVPLVELLPGFHDAAPIYGSGGFTSYTDEQLIEQLEGWMSAAIPRVKIKVGRHPDDDPHRLDVAREAIGEGTALFVDANGAFEADDALLWATRYGDYGVSWFEEPVSSEDLAGMRRVRDRAPAGMAIAAGEYGWGLSDLAAMADCVDVLQADVTRCGGITGFLAVDGVCRARGMRVSAHCAPAISAHACCGIERLAHVEYFHDHVRVERMLFDGTLDPSGGELRPDRSRAGLGLELKRSDAAEHRV
jgi:L-alanine-DL-glutamate epimerase-like enolase superfamily enzyme